MRQGLQRFVLETVAPLNRAVGDAWMRGELLVFEEHLYTELLKASLRTAINAFPRQMGSPRVLLTTLPSEQHGLGLLMVEALLVPEGAQCISLGPQTPLEDIRRAALAHQVDIVALSFSAAFPLRQATDGLANLRRHLPRRVALWAGGEMTRRVRKTLPGVVLLPDLAASVTALRELARVAPGHAAILTARGDGGAARPRYHRRMWTAVTLWVVNLAGLADLRAHRIARTSLRRQSVGLWVTRHAGALFRRRAVSVRRSISRSPGSGARGARTKCASASRATLRLLWHEYRALAGAAPRMMLYGWLVRDPAPARVERPVLLLHGVLCNAGVWMPDVALT